MPIMMKDKENKTCMMQDSDKPESNDATDMQRNGYSDPGLLLIVRYSPDMQQECCKNGEIIYLRQQKHVGNSPLLCNHSFEEVNTLREKRCNSRFRSMNSPIYAQVLPKRRQRFLQLCLVAYSYWTARCKVPGCSQCLVPTESIASLWAGL